MTQGTANSTMLYDATLTDCGLSRSWSLLEQLEQLSGQINRRVVLLVVAPYRSNRQNEGNTLKTPPT